MGTHKVMPVCMLPVFIWHRCITSEYLCSILHDQKRMHVGLRVDSCVLCVRVSYTQDLMLRMTIPLQHLSTEYV